VGFEIKLTRNKFNSAPANAVYIPHLGSQVQRRVVGAS